MRRSTWSRAMCVGFLIGTFPSLPLHAEEVRSESMLANTCAGCHGTLGASAGEVMPIIGGMDKGYLVEVLTDYKTGRRPSTIMGRIMQGYGDVVAAINGEAAPAPSYVNTCYSIIAPEHGISVAGVYRLEDGRIVDIPGAGGVSPADADARTRTLEQQFALDWFRNITSDMFT
ncbi:FCSD flavin-binding domain-containing protein [Thiocapsa sp.]|uniref:FCSD flavin-binding domain-containing protein n=1 Tax=Thiocapsa sp. TaxID=2024551 RepID=UPI0026003B2E|nr:FCSD flavin-binding domain-containing protein [Thiocapsa sp.]